MEFFGWRQFRNRKEVAALAGLTGTPYDSDGTRREQGISKAGNAHIRSLIVELAWLWLRYQPNSGLSRWFNERWGPGSSRSRRVGIVALARKLLIALWHFVEHGVVPEGATFKPSGARVR
jgi:transposase